MYSNEPMQDFGPKNGVGGGGGGVGCYTVAARHSLKNPILFPRK